MCQERAFSLFNVVRVARRASAANEPFLPSITSLLEENGMLLFSLNDPQRTKRFYPVSILCSKKMECCSSHCTDRKDPPRKTNSTSNPFVFSLLQLVINTGNKAILVYIESTVCVLRNWPSNEALAAGSRPPPFGRQVSIADLDRMAIP